MSKYIKTTQDIYDLVIDLLDGDEFQSDNAAERSMNSHYQELLNERPWYFLNKNKEIPVSNLSLSQITDIYRPIRIWSKDSAGNVSLLPLKEAPYYDRFNPDFDYWIDYPNVKIVLINNTSPTGSLLVDYIYSPNPLSLTASSDFDTEPVIPIAYRPLLALRMVLDYKKLDEAIEMFKENGYDYEKLHNQMILDDTNHKQFYAS